MSQSPRRRLAALFAVLPLAVAGSAARSETILFVGNSFTQGAHSAVWRYRPESVTDLNGDGVGGVPALFKRFTDEAGLNYQVSLETRGGTGLEWHWANKRAALDKPWDHVVLQSYSTMDQTHPGDRTVLIQYARTISDALAAKNPKVDVRLTATWSRADLTYKTPSPWLGKPIDAMANDLACGYGEAAKSAPHVAGVLPVGLAFNRAIRTGVADPNPFDGLTFGQVDLWTFDQYHASVAGYYIEALVAFGAITGRAPLSLGKTEAAAEDLGLSPTQAVALQQVAHDQLAAGAPPAC